MVFSLNQRIREKIRVKDIKLILFIIFLLDHHYFGLIGHIFHRLHVQMHVNVKSDHGIRELFLENEDCKLPVRSGI